MFRFMAQDALSALASALHKGKKIVLIITIFIPNFVNY